MDKQKKIERILEVLLKYTVLDFSEKIPLSLEEDEIDAIAFGLNTLATELKDHINFIKEQNKKIEAIFEHAPDPMLILNEKFELVTWNSKADTKFALSEKKINQPIFRDLIIHPNFHDRFDKFSEKIKNVASDERLTSEFLIIKGNNEIIEAEIRFSAFNTEKNRQYILILRDISLQKAQEKMLLEAKIQAEESGLLKESFLANMSHEIRTPMNAIIGFTDLLLQQPLGSVEFEYVNTIKHSGELLLGLVNDILDLSKIEAGLMQFQQEPFSLAEINKSLMAMLEPKANEKQLSLSFIVDTDLPNILIGDGLRWSQVMVNLINNAIKFTESGSVIIHLRKLNQSGNKVKLGCAVKDTGIGIPENKIKDLFQRFHQVSTGHARSHGGTGLGLNICKQLIEQQGGLISVESKEGVGTTFHVELDFGVEENQQIISSVDAVFNPESVVQLSVLLVEDNALNIKLIQHIVSKYNWNITIAQNGLEALDCYKSGVFDIILMDIEMPEMNGLDATIQLRNSLNCSLPILAMTAHAYKNEFDQCIDAGMNDVVVKPINVNDLLQKVANLVAFKV